MPPVRPIAGSAGVREPIASEFMSAMLTYLAPIVSAGKPFRAGKCRRRPLIVMLFRAAPQRARLGLPGASDKN